MDTIILAGGYARRMAPITNEVSKPLLSMTGRFVLNYILDSLEELYSREEGVCYLSVNRKYEVDFRNFIMDPKTEIQLELVVEDTESEDQKLGSIGALKQIQEQVHIRPGSVVLVLGGDNVSSLNISDFVNYQQRHQERSAVALYDIGDLKKASLYGVAELDTHDDPLGRRIVGFEEKSANPKSTLVSTAIYMFRAEDLARTKDYIAQGNNADTLGSYIKWLIAGEPGTGSKGVNGFVFGGYWFDIGSRETFEEAIRFFRKKSRFLDPPDVPKKHRKILQAVCEEAEKKLDEEEEDWTKYDCDLMISTFVED